MAAAAAAAAAAASAASSAGVEPGHVPASGAAANGCYTPIPQRSVEAASSLAAAAGNDVARLRRRFFPRLPPGWLSSCVHAAHIRRLRLENGRGRGDDAAGRQKGAGYGAVPIGVSVGRVGGGCRCVCANSDGMESVPSRAVSFFEKLLAGFFVLGCMYS